MFQNPDDASLVQLFRRVQRIAVVGLSPDPSRPSYEVAQNLLNWGYTVLPVRPDAQPVLGQTAYPSLSAVPGPVDLVDIFRKAEDLGPIIDEAIALKLPALWIQLGIVNEAAAQRARDAGLLVLMDRCIKLEYLRLMG